MSTTVLHVKCQPDGPTRGIAKACEPVLRQAKARAADLFILVIDREKQTCPPGNLAAALTADIKRLGPWSFEVEVVYKDRTFENWLIADLDALRAQPARFKVSAALARQVEPDKADSVEALGLLKSAVKGKQYEKAQDSQKIAERMDLTSAARNSRSIRHLLHVLVLQP